MIYDLNNEYQVTEFKEAVRKHLEQGNLVEFKRKFPLRSKRQNNLLHLWLGYFACEYGCSLEEVKIDIYKRECNRELFEREVTNKHGKTIKVLRSSADLTTEEMSLSMERFKNYAGTGGIYLPAPEDVEFIAHCMREIERNKLYIGGSSLT